LLQFFDFLHFGRELVVGVARFQLEIELHVDFAEVEVELREAVHDLRLGDVVAVEVDYSGGVGEKAPSPHMNDEFKDVDVPAVDYRIASEEVEF
jgi:hypothetical protein